MQDKIEPRVTNGCRLTRTPPPPGETALSLTHVHARRYAATVDIHTHEGAGVAYMFEATSLLGWGGENWGVCDKNRQ